MIARLLATAVVVAVAGTPAFAQIGKDSKLLAPFKPIVAKANESTVRIKCDDKDTILGTVVDEEGYILTKLSELKGVIYVHLPDGSEHEATTVAAHRDTDLALLKVDLKGLKAVKFADTAKIPQGNWLAAAGPNSDPISVGIVSVMTRKLTGFSDTRVPDLRGTNPNRGYLGVMPDEAKDAKGKVVPGTLITEVTPGGAADKGGLLADDVIVEMNGKTIDGPGALRGFLDTMRGGDVITLKVRRKDEMKELKVTLAAAPPAAKDRGEMQNAMGSTLSTRRTGFPLVLQTDLVVDARDCGGPVVDLDGNVLGINIARAGRVETWILPSEVIRPLLPDLKAGKFAPPAVVKLPVAPPPHAPKTK